MVDAVLEATVKLDKLTKSQHDLFLELDVLESFEVALVEDPSRAVQEDLDVKLWRHLLYTQIDASRKAIASSTQLEQKKLLSEQLDSAILSYLGRLDFILERLNGVEASEAVKRIRLRLTLYCGDLLRYRCSHNGTFQSFDAFSAAQERYFCAIDIDPEDGTAFNQLAVIESLKESQKSTLKILFYYARAAVSKKPFNTAKENLIRLSRKAESIQDPVMRLVRRMTDGRPVEDALKEAEAVIATENDKFYFYASIKALSFAFSTRLPLDVDEALSTADESLLKLLFGSEIIDEAWLDRRHEPLQLPLSQVNEFEATEGH